MSRDYEGAEWWLDQLSTDSRDWEYMATIREALTRCQKMDEAGMVVVPRELTDHMELRGVGTFVSNWPWLEDHLLKSDVGMPPEPLIEAWKAMLSAAPITSAGE